MTAQRFDHVLYEQLEQGKSIFIGETHTHPATRQSLQILIPALKARGAQTLSVELRQETVDAMLSASSTDEFLRSLSPARIKSFTGGETTVRTMTDLVRAAKKNGMHVIGHEVTIDRSAQRNALLQEVKDKSPKMHEIFTEIEVLSRENPELKLEQLPTDLRDRLNAEIKALVSDPSRKDEMELVLKMAKEYDYSTSAEGMVERDQRAAEYIRENARGQTIVLGGSHHSGNLTAKDAWMEKTLASGTLLRVPNPRTHIPVENYQGLNSRLGYVAIDYNGVDAQGRIGQTTQTDGQFNDFEAILPRDLRDLKTTSWPPPQGVPTVESIYPAQPTSGGGLFSRPVPPRIPPAPPPPANAPAPPDGRDPFQDPPPAAPGAPGQAPGYIPPIRQGPPDDGRPMPPPSSQGGTSSGLPPMPPRPMTR